MAKENDLKADKKSILSTMLSVSSIVIMSKVIGFIKQIITANAFGATTETDIISLAEGLISNLDYLLIQALSTAFIPIYIFTKKNSEESGKKFAINTMFFFLIITLIISGMLFVFSSSVAKILAPNYSSKLSEELAKYVSIYSPGLVLIVELAIFNSLLKANEVFNPGELIGVNQSTMVIVLVLAFGKKVGPNILVTSFFLYSLLNLIYLMVRSYRFWHFSHIEIVGDANISKLIKLMGPLLLGYSVVFVNQQVDKIIVSGFESGTITAMYYASVLTNFIAAFISSICGVLFTYITQFIAENDNLAAANLVQKSMIRLVTIFMPISIITVMNSADIVQVVFGRGRFDINAVGNCSVALIGYAFMFVPYAIRELFSRFQYAYNDSKTPMINSTVAIGVNILLSVSLSRVMGILGVTLATSISVMLCGVLNYFTSKRKNKYIIFGDTRTIFFLLIGNSLCALVTHYSRLFLCNVSTLVRLIIVVAISLIVYCISTFPLIKQLFQRENGM